MPNMAAERPATWEEGMRIKQALMDYFESNGAYVKLAPSLITGAGVGVIALRDIPSGIDPFGAPNPQLRERDMFVPMRAAELQRMPPAIRSHAMNFFPTSDDGRGGVYYTIPANGFAAFDASWYVNHGDEPNVEFTPPDDDEEGSGFLTLRDVKEGDELLMNYRKAFPDLHARLTRLRGGAGSSTGRGGTGKGQSKNDDDSSKSALAGAVREGPRRWRTKVGRRWYARVALFCVTARVPLLSIFRDEWAAVRLGTAAALRKQQGIGAAILRRRRRGVQVQSLVGLGYTPRIVALAGLMLRSLHVATALPQVFDPPVGLGAGACLAARYVRREWLACLMVGWYAGGAYWRLLGVDAPSGFGGVPVQVRRVRL